MDQVTARNLFEQGAMFILIGFPEGSEFGIDYNSWNVGPNFKGVKMIPPGLHFIYYSSFSSNDQLGLGPRSGFFCNFLPKEVIVRKWNAKTEDIDLVPEDEQQKYKSNKEELDKFLGPYPYEKYKQWVSLTNLINIDIVNLLEPECGRIYSIALFESEASTTQSRKAAATSMAEVNMDLETTQRSKKVMLPKLKKVQGTKIRYSSVPKKKFPDGSTPAEISKYNMDSTYALNLLLAERFDHNIGKLLGEVQFAFICFLIGQNYDSFEQWKKLVYLLCTSGDAAIQHPDVYLDFITILHFQIREIPSEFFVDIVTRNNFLTLTLHELFQNLLSDNIDSKLKQKSISFQKHLTEKFKWDFSTEPDDYAPVVVDDKQ
ncbi:unnamed protein product [Lymnaea stagnalis]|uniref:Protein AAR2 homolog n=1 Tax=Lymnaea stagnalis TaxID=6523 RepID=A0AAV2HC81_LYMST